MNVAQVIRYFKTPTLMEKQTGINRSLYYRWEKMNCIPIKHQYIIEQMTDGDLKVKFEDSSEYKQRKRKEKK